MNPFTASRGHKGLSAQQGRPTFWVSQRISVGGALAFSAVAGLAETATAIRDEGSFAGFRRPPRELDDWLA